MRDPRVVDTRHPAAPLHRGSVGESYATPLQKQTAAPSDVDLQPRPTESFSYTPPGPDVLLQGRLLHRHGLPPSVAAHEHWRVADPAAEGKSPKRSRIVGDAAQYGHIPVYPDDEAVVAHRRELQVAARDIANVVGPRADLAQPRDLHELVGNEPRQRHRVRLEQRLPTRLLRGTDRVLGRGSLSGQRRPSQARHHRQNGANDPVHVASTNRANAYSPKPSTMPRAPRLSAPKAARRWWHPSGPTRLSRA